MSGEIQTRGYHKNESKLCFAYLRSNNKAKKWEAASGKTSVSWREDVVGKFIMSYFRYAYMLRLMQGSH